MITAFVLLTMGLLLDALGVGGWKDRVAFVLYILGSRAAFDGTDFARDVAVWVRDALIGALEFLGADLTRQDRAIVLTLAVTLLTLLAAAMMLRDTPKPGAEGLGKLHARISCTPRRASRLNPRIIVIGALLGILSVHADVPLLATTLASGFAEQFTAFITDLG